MMMTMMMSMKMDENEDEYHDHKNDNCFISIGLANAPLTRFAVRAHRHS